VPQNHPNGSGASSHPWPPRPVMSRTNGRRHLGRWGHEQTVAATSAGGVTNKRSPASPRPCTMEELWSRRSSTAEMTTATLSSGMGVPIRSSPSGAGEQVRSVACVDESASNAARRRPLAVRGQWSQREGPGWDGRGPKSCGSVSLFTRTPIDSEFVARYELHARHATRTADH
jgi:hypothetical protein